MREEIIAIILNMLQEMRDSGEFAAETLDVNTPLYGGKEGTLDSLGLVKLITAVEQDIQDRLDVTVGLADPKALSQTRTPFRSVATLADHAMRVIGSEAQ
jgi:acyl carrier protein